MKYLNRKFKKLKNEISKINKEKSLLITANLAKSTHNGLPLQEVNGKIMELAATKARSSKLKKKLQCHQTTLHSLPLVQHQLKEERKELKEVRLEHRKRMEEAQQETQQWN